jgi:4-hydroxy-tetrahydrodipicolinate reductase
VSRIKVAVLGASGRMGRTLVPLIGESDDLHLSGALAAPGDPSVGTDAGTAAGLGPLGVTISDDPDRALSGAAVAIDFTLPAPSLVHARRCLAQAVPLVIGTTGHDAAGRDELQRIAGALPVVMAPNMSLGVNLLLRLAELAAGALGPDYDAEIVEAHHRHKVDAPSGTALGLGRAVARGRGTTLEEATLPPRQGATGPRPAGGIGFAVLRGGSIVGDHSLVFAGPGERLVLAHHAEDRSGFARGALVAARWLVGRSPGLHTMQDVLGL